MSSFGELGQTRGIALLFAGTVLVAIVCIPLVRGIAKAVSASSQKSDPLAIKHFYEDG